MSGKLDWGKDSKRRRAVENGSESVEGSYVSPGIGRPVRPPTRSDEKVVVVRHGSKPSAGLVTTRTRVVAPSTGQPKRKIVHTSRQPLPKAPRPKKGGAGAGGRQKGTHPKSHAVKLGRGRSRKPEKPPTKAVSAVGEPGYDLTWEEFREFHNESVTVNELCDRLGPVVRAYARDGTRKPPDVANRLNKDKHKTALNHAWTRRLARFLLSLIFNTAQGDAAINTSKKQHQDATVTVDQMAERLARLGRVVRAEK